MGGSKRAYAYSKHLHSDVVICYKQRKESQCNFSYGINW